MKTRFALLLLTVMLSTSLFAQKPREAREGMTPQQMAQKMTDRMKTRLELTPEQEKKIYDINLEYAKKQSELRKEKSEKLNTQSDLRSKQQEKINAVLTPEQKAKMEEMKVNRDQRKGPGDKGQHPKGQSHKEGKSRK